MALKLINSETLAAIGDAIRAKTGGTERITPGGMPAEIGSIEPIHADADGNLYADTDRITY